MTNIDVMINEMSNICAACSTHPNFIESIFSHIDYNKTICNEKHRLAYNYYYKKVNNFNLIQLYSNLNYHNKENCNITILRKSNILIVNFSCKYYPYKYFENTMKYNDGYIMKFIYDIYISLEQIIHIIVRHSTYLDTIYFTGHHIGGCIAQFFCFRMIQLYNINSICITFGSPAFVNNHLKNIIQETIKNLYNYIEINDPILNRPKFNNFKFINKINVNNKIDIEEKYYINKFDPYYYMFLINLRNSIDCHIQHNEQKSS